MYSGCGVYESKKLIEANYCRKIKKKSIIYLLHAVQRKML